MLSAASRDVRTMSFGAIVIALLLALARGVPAWRRHRHESLAALELEHRQLREARALNLSRVAIIDSLSVRRAALDSLRPRFFFGVTRAQAAAALANQLIESATASRVSISSVSLRPDPDSTAVVHVGARVSASASVEPLAYWLSLLEGKGKLLAIRDMRIVRPEAALPGSADRTLRIELYVDALALLDSIYSRAFHPVLVKDQCAVSTSC